MDVSVDVFSWRKPPGELGWWLVNESPSLCLVEDVTLYLSDLQSRVHLNQQPYGIVEVLGRFPAFP